MSKNKSYKYIFIGLITVLIVCFILNLSLGSIHISTSTILDALFNLSDVEDTQQHIIINYRLPKAITALLVGSGLGIAGLLMQTLFRNPLAGPYVLGLSSGASLGVAILILGVAIFGGWIGDLLVSSWSLITASSLGSFLVLLVVLLMSARIKDTMAILIIGLMFASLTGAIVSVLSYFSDASSLQQYIFWGFGSLGNLNWTEILIFSSIYVVAMLLSISCLKALDALLLGDQYAQSLGLNLKKIRFIIIIATSLIAGTITAFAGPIAFIGLAVPHLTKLVFNTSNHRVIFPAVILIGAVLMLLCDIIAQLPYSEHNLPINAITSLIGAPIVIWLLTRKKKLFV